jgi:hypothetical protein
MSFDRWGLKHKKINVLGIVVYFINKGYKNVICFIGLPELPEHKKTNIDKFISALCI